SGVYMVMLNDNKDDNHDVAIEKTASIIESKWTTLIVRELLSGKKRYSELQKGLSGISPKVLTTRLRMLEQEKLITRKIFPTVPPTVEYKLTALGQRLEVVLYAMAKFGEGLK
ncbi:MAG: helix-turn-helix domain-containing protein, partial [Ghiorsea sp.]